MFSGITQGLFLVNSLLKRKGLQYTVILNEALVKDLKVGASVAIDGVCQTVVHINGSVVRFDAVSETLAKTTLNTLVVGRKVSVERSVRVGDEMGGHSVSGHVFERAVVHNRKERADGLTLNIQCSEACFAFIKTKGFVALDGSSLTIGLLDHRNKSFEVHLIPETLRVTNFSHKGVGSLVNLEPDAVAMILIATIQEHFSAMHDRLEKIETEVRQLK